MKLFCRLGAKRSIKGLDLILFKGGGEQIGYKDIIELEGKPGSGKTAILIHLIVETILPENWKGIMTLNFPACYKGLERLLSFSHRS